MTFTLLLFYSENCVPFNNGRELHASVHLYLREIIYEIISMNALLCYFSILRLIMKKSEKKDIMTSISV